MPCSRKNPEERISRDCGELLQGRHIIAAVIYRGGGGVHSCYDRNVQHSSDFFMP